MSISLKELQENAKYLAFPSYNKVNDTSCYFCDERHEWVKLPPTGGVYKGWKGNEHHYTTEYHRQYVLPAIESMFHFGYKESDFTVRKNVISSTQRSRVGCLISPAIVFHPDIE